MSKSIKVLFFARIREAVGTAEETLTGDNLNTAEDVLNVLINRGEPWASALSAPQLLVAVNQEMTAITSIVTDGDEVAFFPPVTGG